MNLSFKGKVVLITGAAHGIGKATAAAFHAHGAQVALLDLDATGAASAAAELGDDRAMGVAADVVKLDEVTHAVQLICARWHSPDILVNNAGFPKDGFITKISPEDWKQVIDVILVGAFNCTRATVGAMHERRWGRVINISSRSHLGNPGQTNYSAAKAGLNGMLKLDNYAVLKERSIAKSPLRRIGMPEEIADAVLFLASESSGYITGDVLHVTGGRYS